MESRIVQAFQPHGKVALPDRRAREIARHDSGWLRDLAED